MICYFDNPVFIECLEVFIQCLEVDIECLHTHTLQRHLSLQNSPYWKHSQYFFKQPDLRHRQPLLWEPVTSCERSIFVRNASGFLSKMARIAESRCFSVLCCLSVFRGGYGVFRGSYSAIMAVISESRCFSSCIVTSKHA